MDETIIRVLQGNATPEEARRLRVWRSTSPENDSRYREIADMWGAVAEMRLETTPPNPSSIRVRAQVPAVISIEARRGSRTRRLVPLLLAAAAIAGLFVGRSVFTGPSGPVLQIQELATGPTETLMTELSDGTTVYLAPGSSLRVSSTPGIREVHLQGKAFFGVAKHGGDWPFVVRGTHGTVHVLGTRFEFAAEDHDLRVIVLDGAVDFSAAGERVQLRGGQMSVSGEGAQPVLVDVEDVDELLGWMGNSLIFNETPLGQAAREIESRFDAVVEVVGEDMARLTISGGFNRRSFGEILAVICRVVDAECEIGEAHAIITARGTGIVPHVVPADTPQR